MTGAAARNCRRERDSLGEVEVPARAYFGAQTVRALANFPISGRRPHVAFIRAYARIKGAAAAVNAELGGLPGEVAAAIVAAAGELEDGASNQEPRALGQAPQALAEWIVVDVYSSGAGTALHMNVNEVLANRAGEILGSPLGSYRVHPHDHVNFAQSTNDTFPTAMRLATLELAGELDAALARLQAALAERAQAFATVVKAGRTHLMDALPVTLGQEFGAYASAVGAARRDLAAARGPLRSLGLGGSAVGTGVNVLPGYAERVAARLAAATGENLVPAADLHASMQSLGDFVRFSAVLRGVAIELTRLCNDLRLMNSGPHAGFAEIRMPAVQPGSSIMPGKVNPTLAEMLTMVAFQVIGYDHAISLAAAAGQLELNVMMPLVAANLCDATSILANAVKVFATHAIPGIEANPERCAALAAQSSALATVLAPILGYDRTAELVQEAQATREPIGVVLRRHPDIPADLVARLDDLLSLTRP